MWAAVNAPGEDTSLDQDIYPYSALDLAQVVCTTFGVERKITFSNRNESAPCLHLSWQKAKRFFDVGVPMTLEVGTGRMAQWAKSVDARATPEFDEVEVWSECPEGWLNAFDRSDETQARSVRQFTSCARSRPSSVRERTRGWPPVYSGRSGGDGAVASLISKVARSYAERGFVSTNQEIVRRLRRQRDGGSTSASAPEATQDDDRQALENVVPVAEPVSPSVALRMHLGLTSNLAYAEERGIPVDNTERDIYSRDENIMHVSHEGGPLEDPWNAPEATMWRWTVDPRQAPDKGETLTIGFARARPVTLDGEALGGSADTKVASPRPGNEAWPVCVT